MRIKARNKTAFPWREGEREEGGREGGKGGGGWV